MNIVFRVDAAQHIGTGHLQRCLTLARYLKSHHHECIFICRDFGRQYYQPVIDAEFGLEFLSSNDFIPSSLDTKLWLGVSQEQDAIEVLEKLGQRNIDLCVVDHYAIDYKWQTEIKKCVKKILVIDDLANRKHNCDYVLDQNYYTNYENRYAKLIPSDAVQLLGPRYILLRDEFLILRHDKKNQHKHHHPKILVNFGGVGDYLFLKEVITAINQVKKFEYIVVTGKLAQDEFQSLQKLANAEHIRLLESTTQMAKLMSICDFALGACGSTVWERFCLGLNASLVQVADNQKEILHYLVQENLIDYLGDYRAIQANDIVSYLIGLDIHHEKYKKRYGLITKIVDGLGVQRVVNTLMEIR